MKNNKIVTVQVGCHSRESGNPVSFPPKADPPSAEKIGKERHWIPAHARSAKKPAERVLAGMTNPRGERLHKIVEWTKPWLAVLTGLLFLSVQTDLAYASSVLISPEPFTPISSNHENLENVKSAKPLSLQVHQNKTFSVVDYDFQTGALRCSRQFEVAGLPGGSSTADYRLINEIYFNAGGKVQYILDYGEEGIQGRRDFNYRIDGALLRIDARPSADLNTPVLSATYFKGSPGKEQPTYVVDFDREGTILAVHLLSFNSHTGALNRVDQKKDVQANEPLVASTFFAGDRGLEEAFKILSYNNRNHRGSVVMQRMDCSYEGGALRQIVQRTSDDERLPIYSKTRFEGTAGQERPFVQFTYDPRGQVMSRTHFYYSAEGELTHSATWGERGNLLARQDFRFDSSGSLSRIDTRDGDRTLRNSSFLAEGQIHHALSYDLEGDLENRYDYLYRLDAGLARIEIRSAHDASSHPDEAIFFEGDKDWEVPVYGLTFDSEGEVTGVRRFAFQAEHRWTSPLSGGSHEALLPPSAATLILDGVKSGSVYLPPFGEGKSLLRNYFGHDPQGALAAIDVRAGPGMYLKSFWKGAN